MVRMILGTAAVSLVLSMINAVSATAGFVAKDDSISFALNIPEKNPNNDLYFSISGPSSCSWIAVGMGSDKMKNSLMFMMYADSTGNNVTLSPRIATGENEPSHTKDIVVEAFAGTRIFNDTFTWNGRCRNCTSWKGGSIGPTNMEANFIWATGPPGNINSNSLHANIKRHDTYGVFAMDLSKAMGAAAVPAVPTSNSKGSSQFSEKADGNVSSAAHAVLMVLVFVGLLPLGLVILRFFNCPRWHALNQTISLMIALIGLGIGAQMGTLYNRTKGFKSGHEIFGLIIVVAMVGQWILGFLHHRMYKKTSTTTKFAPIHVWLGRIIIPAGIINGFIGFPLALNPKFDYALLACTLLIIIIFAPLLFWGYKRRQAKEIEAITSETEGYQAEPWRAPQAQYDINLNHMNMGSNYGVPPSYNAAAQQNMQQQQQTPGQSSHNLPMQQGMQFV
ncbi:64ed4aa7-5d22-46e6-b052-7faf0cc60abd [Sclerotinia trifoliorum]|uniref:64ed4aa7-5d22-46e6-b052-7faf0cc60abd n=1 Tax=Sclerotinia trifoliorum TaxID=28548 RepID=A0A8H2VV18_9HELO|nr:64ed4aa7-5d22-46e6-b052-7faf0cc60abd [Sclerotinia trifoliorum]